MNRHRILGMATALACVVLVSSACATSSGPGSDPGAGWPGGRTFLSTVVTENGAPHALVTGTRIELAFGSDGQLQAHSGCNSLAGKGRLAGSTLVVAELSQTDMACLEDGLMTQDTWLAELLQGRPILQLSGNELTLTRGTTVVTLLDQKVADPDRPLAGTRWVVDTLIEGDLASAASASPPASIELDPAGTFQAGTGCASGSLAGTWTTVGDRLTLVATDDHPCPASEANRVDQAVRSVLAQPLSYQITADRLRLLGSDGTGLALLASS